MATNSEPREIDTLSKLEQNFNSLIVYPLKPPVTDLLVPTVMSIAHIISY